ncbi:MAG: hypothetical protein A3B34_02780 [Candidatus Sungbacteria bacterium RIFCSPLOWO2_01_FULL_54_21]|uniref:DUF7282 domain-containing protein n=2 Tax=Candidatus Sungiibacteriota TaxID=1817917 RepID=A0A1G2L6T6_9BACT|nr:MAG: hypothetical protein A2679_00675 [Candidatus Sungbacteria bacterium RIFCSPHIGHO2_01_FULL_54_26]OHA02553.1 MAG: hypothetical protein A3C92_02810 [Candidatus Sungbacteria bacterium RIFCSPHIGHO2_02_FULL_53_17]OHA07355.1 MAG: hypothetical protein A3B34_02780 [Candidatus Sungbacteria bacterium RIFCSPLOWO2_01_FULL_54_21]
MMEPLKKSYPTLIIVFVIAFLLGYGTSARIINKNKTADGGKTAESAGAAGETGTQGEAQTAENAEEENPASALAQISASMGGISTVSADNQTAGTMVALTVKAEKDTWVAIHEDKNGKPGNILGAQLFAKGTHTGNVELLRSTTAGMKYYAMLHADNGDKKFDYAADMPLAASTGGMIAAEFMAQ